MVAGIPLNGAHHGSAFVSTSLGNLAQHVKNSRVINTLALIALTAGALRLYFFAYPTPPPIDPRPHRMLGTVLANEAGQALNSGGRLLVIARENAEFRVPAADAQLAAFLETTKKLGKTVTLMRSVKVDPLRVVGVPPGDFLELLRQAKEEDVIVSFLGPPLLAEDQLAKLGTKRPRVIAACPGAVAAKIDLRRVFDQKLLTLAVVNRPDAPAQSSPGDERHAFDEQFKVVNAGNLAELTSLGTGAGTGSGSGEGTR